MQSTLKYDEIEIGSEVISLFLSGEEVIDFHNECAITDIEISDKAIRLSFIKITDSKYYNKYDRFLMVFENIQALNIKIDPLLDDWSSFEYIKLLGSDIIGYEISIAEMVINFKSNTFKVSTLEPDDNTTRRQIQKMSYRIPVEKKSNEEKSMMSNNWL